MHEFSGRSSRMIMMHEKIMIHNDAVIEKIKEENKIKDTITFLAKNM